MGVPAGEVRGGKCTISLVSASRISILALVNVVEDRARRSQRDWLSMMKPEFEPDVEVLLARSKAERACEKLQIELGLHSGYGLETREGRKMRDYVL